MAWRFQKKKKLFWEPWLSKSLRTEENLQKYGEIGSDRNSELKTVKRKWLRKEAFKGRMDTIPKALGLARVTFRMP